MGFDVTHLYRDAPWKVRAHVALRWKLFPFPSLIELTPSSGTLVEVGCGYGLWAFYLAAVYPHNQIWGIDPDEYRIKIAKWVAEKNHIENVHFKLGLAHEMVYPQCAAATFIDVLYLIPFEIQELTLKQIVNKLDAGGKVLIKEMSRYPRWKYVWNLFEEWFTIRVLHITYGRDLYIRSEEDWNSLLGDLGLKVETFRLDKGYLHPHILFIGQKP